MGKEKFQYFNREIGWLKFNERVLYQAKDSRTPLLERVKFLNIYHSNLDEFFMKRVGGLKRQDIAGVLSTSIDGWTAREQLQKIRETVLAQSSQFTEMLNSELLEELSRNHIHLLSYKDLKPFEDSWCQQFFKEKVFPVLTPMAVDLGHPFPLISNLSTSLAVSLKAPGEEDLLFARLKIPSVFPMWIELPAEEPKEVRFISVVELVTHHLNELFPNMEVHRVMPFRVTRSIDVQADEEGAEDLLELIEEEVKQRRFAEVVRLEHGPNPDRWLLNFLLEELELTKEEVFGYPIKLELKDLSSLGQLTIPRLKYPQWQPLAPLPLADDEANIFNIIREGDILVHHPFDSFNSSVERLITRAAKDPKVVAIKMTLYRTGDQSLIIQSLIRAAEAGKQVVCLVELKARLDEERNIRWAQKLERSGVHVVYGIVGLKTHSKLALIVRREKDEFRSYVHIGTGNYNSQTARLYTDVGLLTSNPQITGEVVEVFHFLTGRSLKRDYNRLLISPINMKESFIEKIEKESQHAKKGKPALIIAKFNSLEDKETIDALYRASNCGVKIELIVRGFSCLIPEAKGFSSNIRLRSIIGPFLEHSRIFYFGRGHKDPLKGEFYIGSADWMSRNLERRVEVAAPVLDQHLKLKLWQILSICLNDNRLAWQMDSKGDYRLLQPKKGEKEVCSHEVLMEEARSRGDLLRHKSLVE